ncbi:MAG: tRNA dihydrouridine(20/20a) synthase DusA [Gammaproteobacteria bacterium]|nr:tRNA dihydrouridine(20/20a) synthase DusA [Gammaproteobacteria bacterium]
MPALDRSFCIAPMLDKTDRHYRYFARLLTRHALLYTEMITTGAILKGDAHYHLKYSPQEHPLALQLGGSNPDEMTQCAVIANDYGYDEVNINVGCPSDRVQSGLFGACLMAEPDRIAECVSAMSARIDIPVTVKTRIGIDHNDSYEALTRFIDTVSAAGCQTFIIHARKAWLSGLSPRENREIPPLRYDVVYQLKRDFPQLEIIINGGIKTLAEARVHLLQVDGVMVGREAYSNPYLLKDVDHQFYGSSEIAVDRRAVLTNLLPYLEAEIATGTKMKHITRHILGLFQGVPGARKWRQQLSDNRSLSVDNLREMISTLA